MKIQLVSIGNELLTGQTTDTNAAYIAKNMSLLGYQVMGVNVIPDNHEIIVKILSECSRQADLVITTGGLGPTKDDITKNAIAEFLGVTTEFNAKIYNHIKEIFAKIKVPLTEAHRLQCYFPQNTILLPNNLGTAPGMWSEKHQIVLVNLPGVPYEMKDILQNQIIPRLTTRWPSTVEHKTLLTAGTGESILSEMLEDFEKSLPKHLSLAYLPDLARVRLRLSEYNTDSQNNNKDLNHYFNLLEEIVGDQAYGYEDISLAKSIGNILMDRNLKVGTAESCTGGYLGHLFTSDAGSSAYYQGGIIAYSNEMKIHKLGVSESTLVTHGAVSEQTVIEMITGLIDLWDVDIGIAVSGIAGPGGGTPDKPVGLIWLACGNKKKVITQKIIRAKDRLLNIEYAAYYGLNMARKFLLAN